MSSTVEQLQNKKLINPPRWLASNVMYETITGSISYGISSDSSDYDIVGWCIPTKDEVFKITEIVGFDEPPKRFEQFIQHGVHDEHAMGGKGRTYDITIFSIVKYFKLCLDNNPNFVDTLYTPYECILHATNAAKLVRDNRDIFLHKGSYKTFLNYAFSQLHKLNNKNPEGKRKEIIETYGYDVKYCVHLARLAYECQMILDEHTLDLRRHNEHLKAIRRGEVSKEDILKWFGEKELQLQKSYRESTLREKPETEKIRALLLSVLEEHYGNLQNCIIDSTKESVALKEIGQILRKYNV